MTLTLPLFFIKRDNLSVKQALACCWHSARLAVAVAKHARAIGQTKIEFKAFKANTRTNSKLSHDLLKCSKILFMASTTFDTLSLAFPSDLKTLEDNMGHKIDMQGQKLAGEIKDAVDKSAWRFFAALAPIYLASLLVC